MANVLALARSNWSMPPDHGAAAVRVILEDTELTTVWLSELDEMRERLSNIRIALATEYLLLAPIAAQYGIFSLLPLSSVQVARLWLEHAVYMTNNARINVAGLNEKCCDVLQTFPLS